MAYSGPTIDSDVHHTWRSDDEVAAYLPRRWREYVHDSGITLRPVVANFAHPGRADLRMDAFPERGGPPGSDYATLRDQLLDAHGITRAILGFDVGHELAHANPYFAAELARAMNDWSIEHWLSIDDPRLQGKVVVADHQPERAAEEIRRVGDHPKIVEVLLVTNGTGQPFGHPIHDPIHRAADDLGLPVGMHVAPGFLYKNVQYAGGMPGTRFEYLARVPEAHVHHLTSLITHGVFEKFPSLRVMLIECGVAWFPWLMLALDARYTDYRRESDWVRRLPSEYFREHVRVTTQPLDIGPERHRLAELLDALGGMDEILCFATDYPHWDFDDPMYVGRHLPRTWWDGVFHGNAARFYGWDPAALAAEERERAARRPLASAGRA